MLAKQTTTPTRSKQPEPISKRGLDMREEPNTQAPSGSLLGKDAIVTSLIRAGRPLTRANYLSMAMLSEDEMTPELEADLPEEFWLTEEGEQPPEVVLGQRAPTQE